MTYTNYHKIYENISRKTNIIRHSAEYALKSMLDLRRIITPHCGNNNIRNGIKYYGLHHS